MPLSQRRTKSIAKVPPPVNPIRSPYFFQDPIRIAAMACAIGLMYVREVPFLLTVAAIGVSQFNGVMMLIGIIGEGWSSKHGRKIRSSMFTSCLATDWVNTSVCTLVGAMFLMRLFGPPVLVSALGWLTLAIGLLPDIRFCRVILPQDAKQANSMLTAGWFFRDPVKLGALAAMGVVCFLDRTSLAFIFVSMILLQINSLLIMVDKYLGEVEAQSAQRVPFRMMRFFFDRDGQRLLLTLVPLGLVPLRLGTADTVTQYTAAAIAALIVLPDVFRGMSRLFSAFLGIAPFKPRAVRAV